MQSQQLKDGIDCVTYLFFIKEFIALRTQTPPTTTESPNRFPYYVTGLSNLLSVSFRELHCLFSCKLQIADELDKGFTTEGIFLLGMFRIWLSAFVREFSGVLLPQISDGRMGTDMFPWAKILLPALKFIQNKTFKCNDTLVGLVFSLILIRD